MLRLRKIALLLLVGGVSGATAAFGQSGTFTFVTGDVNVQRRDGQRVPVTRGTAVNAGDSIVTGERAMAQLTMVDQAKISLRPNTQFQIEQYADRPDSDQGALLNLVRGTLRTFTGLIASRNRDKFVMKTKVATVGIRGSGNVLFAGTAADCDPLKVEAQGACDITVNHTIEGSHAVTFGDFSAPGLPPQQGGAQTLITGPGQTVLVTARGDVRYIPTPQFIADSANNPTGSPKSSGGGGEGSGEDGRNFGPNDGSGASTSQGLSGPMPVGNNGLGFTFVDASGNLAGGDPLGLQNVVVTPGTTLYGQSLRQDLVLDTTNLRGYRAYAGTQTGVMVTMSDGAARDAQSFSQGDLTMSAGRWQNARISFFEGGSSVAVPGSIHWIYAGSAFPAYLSDVLTGTATYTPVMNTNPTNQANTSGTLNSAQLDVNFSSRTLNASINVSMPAAGSNGGGSWVLSATGVPFALGSFFASTADNLRVTSSTGANSGSNPNLYGSLQGSFVGSGLRGAIVGYNFSDRTSSNSANHNTVSGVIGFQGPPQNSAVAFRDGLVSDVNGQLTDSLTRNYATTDRPDEVKIDAQGRADSFAAPYGSSGGHQVYSRGTASVAQSGVDPETGLVWGRWSGGVATVNAGGQTVALPLDSRSLHYVFSPEQSGPVSLPLTGTATYSLIGSTSPTDGTGHTGNLNSASLAANFSNRTVDLGVNLTIAGQTINGAASGVPIYRDQYFSAFRGNVPAGLPVPQLLNITCTPSCPNPVGSVDGFFSGRTGQGAGMMYNLNGATGAAALRRNGG